MSKMFNPQNPLLRTHDGRNVILAEDVFYFSGDGTCYCAPSGSTSDGCSTPPELWPSIPPFGTYWLAAVFHDCAYRGTLTIWSADGAVRNANLTKVQSDDLFLSAMMELGTPLVERNTIYEGVHLFGWKAFRDDRETK